MTTSSAERPGGSLRKLVLPAIAAVCGLAVLLSLGFWQLDRLAWKEALIAKVSRDVGLPAVPAPGPETWPGLDMAEADYRHVAISGKYLPGTALYYFALTKSKNKYAGPGYLAYSPFKTDAGWTVMVNRGFVPESFAFENNASWRNIPSGPQQLTGLLRKSETPNWTTPAADETKRIWFARDTGHMARVLEVGDVALAAFSIDIDQEFTPETGLPQAGETIVRFKNDHLGYALTWFGLAATLIGVFTAYAYSVVRTQPKKNGSA